MEQSPSQAFEENPSRKRTLDEFEMIKEIGQGAFGTVYLSKDKLTDKLVAIKSVNKEQILKLDKRRHIFREKKLLGDLQHPNIIKLNTTLQVLFITTINLCRMMIFFILYLRIVQRVLCLIQYLKNVMLLSSQSYNLIEKFTEDLARQYSAQLISVLEYLQTKRVMHRDLKPQNILLDDNYNIKVIDFGDAKCLDDEDEPEQSKEQSKTLEGDEIQQNDDMKQVQYDPDFERRGTFVGTINYLAPEMIQTNSASMATDIWSVGCIIYKLLTGSVPFTGTNSFLVFQKILNRELDYPDYLTPEAKSLIDSMLVINPKDRLGAPGSTNGMEALKSHPFFKGIDFTNPKSLSVGESQISYIIGEQPKVDLPRKSKMDFVFDQNGLAVVCRGFLLKKNRWFQKQVRYFQLFQNGDLKYYKDQSKYKGKITLQKGQKVWKTGKNQIEIPTKSKSYVLLEIDRKEWDSHKSSEGANDQIFTNDIDKWMDAINLVSEQLL